MSEVAEEKKKVVRFEDGKVLVEFAKEIDTNKDGQPVAKIALVVEIDIAEIPDEAYDAWKKKKAE